MQPVSVDSLKDLALEICNSSKLTRRFSGGEVQIFATDEEFNNLIAKIVATKTKRLLDAIDRLDSGCPPGGFSGWQNGLGEDVGDELENARNELAVFTGHRRVIKDANYDSE